MSDPDVNSPPSSDPAPPGDGGQVSPNTPNETGSAPSQGERQPPPGTREAEHHELLKAVKDVVTIDDDPIVGETPSDDQVEAPKDATVSSPTEPRPDDPLQSDPTDVELDTYKPDTRKRIEQLLAQRNEARQTSERYKADAEAFAQFRDYQTSRQLENDDVNLLLEAGAALRRGDFQGFLNIATPYVAAAQQAVGQVLPEDLQGQVDEGMIPYETARELSMHRINEARLQTEANTYRQNAELIGQRSVAQQIYGAIAEWETATRARDPDWASKQDIVERFSQSLVQTRGSPTSPQQAVAMAQEAYEEANRVVTRLRPQPQPTRPNPSGAHSMNGNGAAPEPRTLMEAAIQGLQRGNARMH